MLGVILAAIIYVPSKSSSSNAPPRDPTHTATPYQNASPITPKIKPKNCVGVNPYMKKWDLTHPAPNCVFDGSCCSDGSLPR